EAAENESRRRSDMTVAFVYRPATFVGTQPVLEKPIVPRGASNADGGQLPCGLVGITNMAYPEYPVNSTAWGSVIVQVEIDASGRLMKSSILRAQEPFTRFALVALKKWTFRPAQCSGKAVQSRAAIAFIFQPLTSQ